jgi:hypothetical protein
MKKENIKPTHSPFIVLRQDCNLIPEHKASLLSNSDLLVGDKHFANTHASHGQ